MEERRLYLRTRLASSIKVNHPESGEIICDCINISEGGIALQVKEWVIPAVGEQVTVQMQGTAIEAPVVVMEIIRIENDIIALKFLENE